MKLIIQSPAGIEAEAGNINAVRTKLTDGKPLTILPKHAPLIGEIGQTHITIKAKDRDHTFAVRSGILMVENDVVKVLTSGMQEEVNA